MNVSDRFSSVDEYIDAAPEISKAHLNTLRDIIKRKVPTGTEVISYNMPAMKLNGLVVVYYAAHKSHAGFYPGAKVFEDFGADLAAYWTSKSTIQIAYDIPVPIELIERVVDYKLAVIESKKGNKKKA